MSSMPPIQTQAQVESQSSRSTGLIVGLVIAVVLLVGVGIFGAWAFNGRQDYKNNVDQKIATAVTQATQAESTRKDAEFAEVSKSPLKSYLGPEAYGSINLQYPKTWSGYVSVAGNNNAFVDGYFNPGVVPGVDQDGATFALRIQVVGDSYSTVMQGFSSGVQDGTVKVLPYKLPKVSSVVGSEVVGQLDNDKKGTMVVLPLRANTLEIWTESDKYLNDFNKYILPNFSFAP